MSQSIALGHFDSRQPIKECGECHSRNIVTVNGVDQEALSTFVRNRASRLNVDLTYYDVKFDKATGAVTAERKPDTPSTLDIDFT